MGDAYLAKSSEFMELKETHNRVLSAYRGQHWSDATEAIKDARAKVETMNGQGLVHEIQRFYNLYVDRIEEFKAEPPTHDWDGAFIATSK